MIRKLWNWLFEVQRGLHGTWQTHYSYEYNRAQMILAVVAIAAVLIGLSLLYENVR
ncbi:MAG: hypothetical protein HYY03_05570 [Chloroflexi bacterium]|nr:hypothetical protein [Chloroflexota bacterium]